MEGTIRTMKLALSINDKYLMQWDFNGSVSYGVGVLVAEAGIEGISPLREEMFNLLEYTCFEDVWLFVDYFAHKRANEPLRRHEYRPFWQQPIFLFKRTKIVLRYIRLTNSPAG